LNDVERHDVVLVGAGLAGLQLASTLVAAGRDVVVVEARDRVGGRVFSHRFANGQWCERGAEFIDESHERVLALAHSLALTMLDRGARDAPGAELLDVGGRTSPLAVHPEALAALADFESAIDALPSPWDAAVDEPDPAVRARPGSDGDQIRARTADRGRFESDGDQIRARTERHVASPAWPADGALTDLVQAHPAGRYASTYLGRAIRTEWMLPPAELSQVAVAARRPIIGRERYRVAGGNDQLATGLADRLGDVIRLSAPVREVDADGRVQLSDGRMLVGEALVVTVPLPVLSRIWPDAPTALTAVGYGVGGKVSFQFGRRLWRDYGRNGSVHSDRAWGQLWDTSDVQPGDSGVLTALLSSHDGAALLAFTDLRQRLLADIERIFPGARGLAGEVIVTDWTNDPWSLGCYSAPAPGQLEAAWPLMHQPHGRLWLAGEHADEHAGFIEGALASADRVAAALLA
jgi:monoamine oxidase